MENQNRAIKKRVHANTWTGLLLLLVGAALFLRQFGYPLPHWLFSWEMILITVGLVIGARNRFQDFSWLIMVVVGLVFLSDDIYPDIRLKQYAVPIIISVVGLLFIFGPRRACTGRHRFRRPALPGNTENNELAFDQPQETIAGEAFSDNVLDIVSIFAGVKKNVLSKQFRGGEVVCVFGGAEINLTNADFTSPVILDVVNVFGGTKLVVPSNWEVRSEATAIFGGIDDKRNQSAPLAPNKVVILKGTIMFGGIEINSFT